MHAELSAIEQEFESALVRLHELRTKVPPDVWKRRPAPERWSPGECVAHLNLSSASMVPLVQAGIEAARRRGASAPARYRRDFVGWLLWKGLGPGKGFKTKAIPAWVPSGDRHPDDLVAEFERWQTQQIASCARRTVCRSTPSRSRRRWTRAPVTTSLPRSRSSHATSIAISGKPSRLRVLGRDDCAPARFLGFVRVILNHLLALA